MPTLCDGCRAPGACCRILSLAGEEGPLGPRSSLLEISALLATAALPFVPLVRLDDGVVLFWCPHLGRDGRCGEYDHRPELCRDYREGSGVICIESPDHVPPRQLYRRRTRPLPTQA
jgi:Fe-S-cluster containining protein